MRNFNKFLFVCAIAILFGIAPVAEGYWDDSMPYKYIQYPDLQPWISMDVDATADMYGTNPPQLLADDFPCWVTGPILDIHIWGSWYHDEQYLVDPMAVMFTLSIHDNIPAGVAAPWSMPGEVRWMRQFQPGDFHVDPFPYAEIFYEGYYNPCEGWYDPYGDIWCWLYNFYLDPDDPNLFYQKGSSTQEVIYWLDVQATPLPPNPPMARFGWKTSIEHFEDDAAYVIAKEPYNGRAWRELRYPQGHELEGQSIDLAFVITGEEEEEPMHELGDAPDSTNSFPPTPMTAYPAGGPPGILANFPSVYGMGSPPHGPIHWQPTAVAYLGQNVTLEVEADIGPDQDPTNNLDPPGDLPDLDLADDGVVFPIVMPHCQPTQFNYTVTVTAAVARTLFVNVWFDFNQDGDWDDTLQCTDPAGVVQQVPEWAVQNQPLNLGAGFHNVTTPPFLCWLMPGGTDPSFMWMRITLSEQKWSPSVIPVLGDGGSGPANGYDYGETEDYYFEPEIPEPEEYEFGDAPEDVIAYPSLGVIGAFPTCMNVPIAGFIQHITVGQLLFGPNVDTEIEGNGGICPAFAPYDNDECFAGGDAGLMFPEPFTIVSPPPVVVPCPMSNGTPLGNTCQWAVWGANIDIMVTNNTTMDAFVNVLIDWDQSGTWGGSSPCPGVPPPMAQEHVLVNFLVPPAYSGPLSVLMPAGSGFLIGPNKGYVWSRFTITDQPVPGPPVAAWHGDGIFEHGETEDYLLRVDEYVPPDEYDFGDAPDPPYPTLLANNGARHLVPPVITPPCLGNSVDIEPDGQPNATATGDDNDGNDDEDGVVFSSPLMPGQWAYVDVTANAAGLLYAWVDFNGDGSWAEAGDQIFWGQPLTGGGITDYLSFWVPFTATPNVTTFARFRFTTVTGIPGLSYDGPAQDGEVEDYEVDIEENPHIKWIQLPDTTPNGIDIKVDNMRWIADDFECTSFGLITDVHLWGSWKKDRKGEIKRIHLSIHSDDPAGEDGSDPDNKYSKPDELLWERDFYTYEFYEELVFEIPDGNEWWWDPATGELNPNGDSQIWRIDIWIPWEEAFRQKGDPCEPVIYWLDVQVDTEQGEFGWKTRRMPEHYMDDAVWDRGSELPRQWKELRYPDGHPYYQRSIDMAFAITGIKMKRHLEHLKWSQPPIKLYQSPFPTPEDTVYCGWNEESWTQDPCESIIWNAAADDFRCIGPMPLTSIHWWGSYIGWEWPKPANQPEAWWFRFFSNVPASADPGTTDYSHPGDLLYEFKVDPARVETEWVGWDMYPDMPPETCFQYHVDLEPNEWFWQAEYEPNTIDNIYWLSIVAVYPNDVKVVWPWGWKTRPWSWMDDAVRYECQVVSPDDILCTFWPIIDPIWGESFDLAFELDTEPNYIKWEQDFCGIAQWPHYEDEASWGIEQTTVETVTKWQQLPDLTELGIDVDATVEGTIMFPPILVPPQLLADDFKCDETGPITDIHIWGSWMHDDIYDPCMVIFTLSIHADIPADQSPTGYSMPGQLLWLRPFHPGEFDVEPVYGPQESYYIPCIEQFFPDDHQRVWKYNFYIDQAEAFIQKEGNIYWLDVQARPLNDPYARFGWKTAVPPPWNDDAVFAVGEEPYDWPDWQELISPITGVSLDLAFEITTEKEQTELFIQRLVADDWKCERQTPVTAIAWWGSYINYYYEPCTGPSTIPPPISPDYFLLQIWDDVPANVDLPYSHPNDVIWEYKAYDYDEVLVGYDKHPIFSPDPPPIPGYEPVFRYSVRLPKERWFRQKDVNDIYWLSVVAVYTPDNDPYYDWGWTNHKHVFGDDAVEGGWVWDPVESWHWEPLYDQTGKSEDMSFVLFTVPGCFPACHDDYFKWLDMGQLHGMPTGFGPKCWCNPRQCHGDANNDLTGSIFSGYTYVGPTDLAIFSAAWDVKEPAVFPTPSGPGIVTIPKGICCDFAHDLTGSIFSGYTYVGPTDLAEFSAWWDVKEPAMPPTPSGPGTPPDCLDCP